MTRFYCATLLLIVLLSGCYHNCVAQAAQPAIQAAQPVILDTDIGDDIDDAFALALALRSPEIKLLAVTSAWGDTATRARILDRLLGDAGRSDVHIGVGIERHHPGEAGFSQRRFAERTPAHSHRAAVDLILETVRQHPNEVTLIAIAPQTNVAAAFRKDPETFRKLKRIVTMGGSIRAGFDDLGLTRPAGPVAEYNIAMDPESARAVYASGVPLFVMPLDSTQLRLDEVKRSLLFTAGSPITDDLVLLYQQWTRVTKITSPIMFDVLAVAYVLEPDVCDMTAMHIEVSEEGLTRKTEGIPNAQVCLHSHEDRFFELYLSRLLASEDIGRPAH